MAGSLNLVDSESVTSGVSAVTLTGIDSTYNVYQVVLNNIECDTDAQDVALRFTTSGSPDTSSNYDKANEELRADTTFGNASTQNGSYIAIGDIGTGTGEQLNGILYLFNFSNASEYSFCTFDTSYINSTPTHRGRQGGGALTVAQATDGITIYMASGNIDKGEFKLYGLKK